MRVGLGQFNAVVGDLAGNTAKMEEIYGQAVKEKVDLLIFRNWPYADIRPRICCTRDIF